MKRLSLLSLGLFGVATMMAANAALYIDEPFDYPNGPLGSPWTIANQTGSSSATVGSAQELNSFTPAGKQVTLTRPTTGDGLISATLPTGANSGTSAWSVATGDEVRLTLDFSFSSLGNSQAFSFFMRGGTTTMLGVRVIGNSLGGARLQYMTTSSTASFTDVAGTPTLSLDTWYRLTIDLTVTSNTSTTSAIMLDQLGTGGGVVYDQSGFNLNALAGFGSSSSFTMGTSSGAPSFSAADINLVAIPEPSSFSIVIGTALLGIVFLRNLRKR